MTINTNTDRFLQDLSGKYARPYLDALDEMVIAVAMRNAPAARASRANLQKVDLVEANLKEANLVEANLKEAVLVGANLQEADLIETNLEDANFAFSIVDGETILDEYDGFVKFESEEQKYARFQVYLPADITSNEEDDLVTF